MKKFILVPMKRNDRAEDFIPYIEEVARTGMRAVFMVPYPVDGFRWSQEECGHKAIEEGMRLADYYNWEVNLRKARERFAPVLESLSAKGIDASVELYSGNLRRTILTYAAKDDIHLIVSRGASLGNWAARWLDAVVSLLRSFAHPGYSPVRMIKPRALL